MTSIYPQYGSTHWYNLERRDPLSDITAAVCDCGYVSEWMLSQPAAQMEADRHIATIPAGAF